MYQWHKTLPYVTVILPCIQILLNYRKKEKKDFYYKLKYL